MMKTTLTFSFLVLLIVKSQGQMNFNFLAGSEMLTKKRDGILTVNLQSGEKVTVCNNGFTDQYASMACAAMGYTMKGITMVSKRFKMAKKLKMVLIKCNPNPLTFRDCAFVTNGRILQNCEIKSRVAHVLCLGKKIKPMVQKIMSQTDCNKNHGLIQFIRLKGKKNTGFIQIRQSYGHAFRFICNSHLNFGRTSAKLFCNLLCYNPFKPRTVMFMKTGNVNVKNGYFRDMVCPNNAVDITQCNHFSESASCDKVFNLALQCGSEIKKQDPLPNIVCSNRSMIIEWSTEQTFHLNASLVSLHPNHTTNCFSTKRNAKKKIIIKIPLDYCNPIITDNENSIRFQYTLNRAFIGDGIVQFKKMESIKVYCDVDKITNIAKEYVHNSITYPPLISNTFLRVNMTLHSGPDFEELLPRPYDIKFYEPVYAKITISDTLSQVKLSLYNCFVTSVKSYSEINSKNSAKVIDESCPVEKYDVDIVPIDKWSIAFQFTSFKIEESNEASFNIFCETMKCLIFNDPECGICKVGSLRKKRSTNTIESDLIHVGPILFH